MGDRPTPALPDVNVLVALTNPAHQHHGTAHAWLVGAARFLTTPLTELGLLRLLLNPAVIGQEVTTARALAVLAGVRSHPRADFLPDATSLADPALDLIGLVGHRQVTDLHLVNLARRHDCTLVTFDRRIPGSLTESDRRHVVVL